MRIIIILFSISLLFIACHKKEVRIQLREVKKLSHQLDSIDGVYSHIDKPRYKKIEKEIYATFDVVKNRDTNINISDSVYMQSFAPWADAGKGINRMFRKKIPGIETELNISKKQLKTLRHDIAKKLIPADSVAIYMQQEKEAVAHLIMEINLVETEFIRCADIYTRRKTEVELFLKSIAPGNLKTE